jgi:iron complex transport system substrate-binding protein
MKDRRRLAALIAAVALGLAGVCVAGASLPSAARAQLVSVHDSLGRVVTVSGPPQRIVAIFSSNVELLASLGLTDRIVGIEAFTRYPPEVLGKPLVGGRLGFSVDKVVALKPDLLVVTPARDAANQLVAPMERLGIPIVVLMGRTVPEILANIRMLGTIAGVPERGEALTTSLEARLAEVRRRVEDRSAPRAVMIRGRVGNGLLLVAQSDTYTGDAMVLAGSRFAIENRGPISQVSPEAILNSDPDVLLYAGVQADLNDLISRPGWSTMRAIRTGRVHIVSRAELLIPGPRTFDGIEHLAALFHPAAFAR